MTTDVRPIPGFSKYRVCAQGRVYGPLGEKKPTRDRDRYLRVSVIGDGGRRVTRSVHFLVALTFHGPRPDGLQIRHLDNDPSNNAPTNLAYGTGKENAADRRTAGTHVTSSVLTQEQVRQVYDLLLRRVSLKAIAETFGVTPQMIGRIRRGKAWQHVLQGSQPCELPHAHHRLTQEMADQIRKRLAAGETGTVLASEYGVTSSLISRVKTGKLW